MGLSVDGPSGQYYVNTSFHLISPTTHLKKNPEPIQEQQKTTKIK